MFFPQVYLFFPAGSFEFTSGSALPFTYLIYFLSRYAGLFIFYISDFIDLALNSSLGIY